MRGESNNLFLRLSKWATRQQESFLTEALAVTLQTLIDAEPVAARRLLRVAEGRLCHA
jgi:hypothetical protein